MISIFFGFALFASVITSNKIVLGWLSPAFFIGVRMLTSGIIIVLFYLIYTKKRWFARIAQDLKLLLFISAIITFIPSVLKAYGLKYLVSSKASLLESLDPFITALYALLLWGEKLTPVKITGMLIGFSGILLMLFTSSPTEDLLQGWSIFSLPELALLVSVIINRYGWIRARSLLENNRYTPFELNALIMIGGGSYALFYSWCCSTCDFTTMPFEATFVATLLYSIVIGNVIGYTLYAYFIKTYNMTMLTLGSLSIPLFVHLYGPLALDEPLSLTFFGALGLVVTGTFIFYWDQLKRGQKKHKPVY